jgi:hypothetical protein
MICSLQPKLSVYLCPAAKLASFRDFYPFEMVLLGGRGVAAVMLNGYRLRNDVWGSPMRVFVFVSLFATLVGTAAFAYEPYPFQRSDGKWGYVNDDHCWVIAPQFEDAKLFSEGLAAVSLASKWGFIRANGATAIAPQFDNALNFHEGVAAVKIGKEWGAADANGKIVINPNFSGGFSFSEGLAAVHFDNGRVGYIDTHGDTIIAPQFTYGFDFENGKAWALLSRSGKGRISGFIDHSGAFISIDENDEKSFMKSANDEIDQRTTTYGFKGGMNEGLSPVVNNEGKWGYVDIENRLIIAQKFDIAENFKLGRARVEGTSEKPTVFCLIW